MPKPVPVTAAMVKGFPLFPRVCETLRVAVHGNAVQIDPVIEERTGDPVIPMPEIDMPLAITPEVTAVIVSCVVVEK